MRRSALVVAVAASFALPSTALPAPDGRLFEVGLSANTDLILLPAARRPAPRPAVTVATRVTARPDAITSVVLNLPSLREALPSLIRADVLGTQPGPRADAWPDRLIAWEVEVPLFNLTGRAWLRQRADGVELTLVEGAFAPGWIRFRATPTADTAGTILTCEMSVEVRSTNWIFRRVAGHDPWAETAMSAATAWVLARAVGLRAEAAPGTASFPARPRDAIAAPAATALDGSLLSRPTLAGLRSEGVVALVRRAPNGRLGWASVAVEVLGSPTAVASRLALPEAWVVFPAWKSVKRRAQPRAAVSVAATDDANRTRAAPAPAPAPAILVDVEDNAALVSLDAVWSVETTLPVHATAVAGDTRGAVLAWQTAPGDRPGSSIAVLSIHPRLDVAGFIERRLIAAEPLLEHACALALAYVDAAAVADNLARGAASAR